MRKFAAAVLGLGFGLGSVLGCGSSSDKGTSAPVDPAAEDFCFQWASGVCDLAYQCASTQDAAFHARFGKSQDVCWQGLEPLCESNQSGSQTFGPSCGPGKKVNTALADACISAVQTEACSSWTVTDDGSCDPVCGAAANPGNGAGGAGNAGGGAGNVAGAGAVNPSGGATSTGSLSSAPEFCIALQNIQCDRLVECDPTLLASTFGTVADCKATLTALCASVTCSGGPYDAGSASSCLAAAKAATCDQLENDDAPEVCVTACPG